MITGIRRNKRNTRPTRVPCQTGRVLCDYSNERVSTDVMQRVAARHLSTYPSVAGGRDEEKFWSARCGAAEDLTDAYLA